MKKNKVLTNQRVESLRSALCNSPNDVVIMCQLAEELGNQKEFTEAGKLFEKAINTPTEDQALVLKYLTKHYLKQELYNSSAAVFLALFNTSQSEALSWLNEALISDKKSSVSIYYLGEELYKGGYTNVTEMVFLKIHHCYPDLISGLLALAQFYFRIKKWPEAVGYYDQLVKGAPTNIIAQCERASVLHALGKIEEASTLIQKQLKKQPNYYLANAVAALIFDHQGYIDKAETYFRRSIRYNTDQIDPYINLADLLLNTGRSQETIELLLSKIQTQKEQRWELFVHLSLAYWVSGDITSLQQLITNYSQNNLNTKALKEYQHLMSILLYINSLVKYRSDNPVYYSVAEGFDYLTVLGESHSLSPAYLVFPWKKKHVQAIPKYISGIKMHHLKITNTNRYTTFFIGHLDKLPPDHHLLLTIGEIDCRPDEGIWRYAKKSGKDIRHITEDTVKDYFAYLDQQLSIKQFESITIQGIPAPAYPLSGEKDPGDVANFLKIFPIVNGLMKEAAHQRGWGFLDIYTPTVSEEYRSNHIWHLDDTHLKPDFYFHSSQYLS